MPVENTWLTTNRPPSVAQLDKLVGVAMLLAASVVFLYYTFWTLFMVLYITPITLLPNSQTQLSLTTAFPPALRRRRPPPPELLPAPRVGHPHPRHPRPARVRRGGLVPQRRHDQEQQEEGGQGQGCRGQEEGVNERPYVSALSDRFRPYRQWGDDMTTGTDLVCFACDEGTRHGDRIRGFNLLVIRIGARSGGCEGLNYTRYTRCTGGTATTPPFHRQRISWN